MSDHGEIAAKDQLIGVPIGDGPTLDPFVEPHVVGAVQWAPSGNPMAGIPSEVVRLLASADGTTRGYGYGPGWSMGFGHEHGTVYVEPGQWVVRYADGRVEARDEAPPTVN